LDKTQQALNSFKKVTELNPNYADGFNNLGVCLKGLGNLDEAIEVFRTAISVKPDHADAYYNLGNSLKTQANLKEATNAYKQVVLIKPNYAEAYNMLGSTLLAQSRLDEAIEVYKQAVLLKPNSADAYNYLGVALKDQGKLDEAIASFNKALSLKPDYAEAYNNMGNVLKKQGKLEETISSYNKALSLKPDYADAYNNMGNALKDQGKLEEAISSYNKALSFKPDYAAARSQKLNKQAHICDWSGIEEDRVSLLKLGVSGQAVAPFLVLSLEDAPERHRLRSEVYARKKILHKPITFSKRSWQKPKRLRIGYFSTDFREHPVAYLIAKVLEQHNRNEFEVFGYSLHGNKQSELRHRLINSFDCFADVQGLSDQDVALRARQDHINIAIDLNGYTENARPGVFAHRAAPIQINYLGYPGTLGADFMDYIIADKFLIPIENQRYFIEKQLYLPHTYMPTDNSRELSARDITRSEMGLPDDAFVFCCFNNNYKITSSEFDIWMRLLNKVKRSVLWLRKSNQLSEINIKKEAQNRKIDPKRIVFACKVPMDEHLARQRFADLFVDTFAFNAHTTATEALWAGLPVVTKIGKGFAARVAGSLLNAVGLPELITESEEEYEALILELATKKRKLTNIKKKLAANRLSTPLFNTEQYTKHLEDGYQQAYQRYFDGQHPDTITVPR
ncbi:tetratricopeptide repeat protein, partial [Paracoccaceae bacterium]|nr:tetratricopeptide repeat protein [Paracoccaceae bacterium]